MKRIYYHRATATRYSFQRGGDGVWDLTITKPGAEKTVVNRTNSEAEALFDLVEKMGWARIDAK